MTRRISRSIGEDVIISDRALADCVTPQRFAAGAVYPDPSGLRAVSAKIPAVVVRQARQEGVGRMILDERSTIS